MRDIDRGDAVDVIREPDHRSNSNQQKAQLLAMTAIATRPSSVPFPAHTAAGIVVTAAIVVGALTGAGRLAAPAPAGAAVATPFTAPAMSADRVGNGRIPADVLRARTAAALAAPAYDGFVTPAMSNVEPSSSRIPADVFRGR